MQEFSGSAGHDQAAPALPVLGVRMRTAIICLLACLVLVPWIENSEIIRTYCEITRSVPAIPALAILFALALLYPLSTRFGRWLELDRRDILLIYMFVSVASVVPGFAAIGLMLDSLAVPLYLDTPENRYADFNDYIPKWLVPHDKEVIRQFFEGNPQGSVPWGAWAGPILGWLVLYAGLWVAMTGLMVIVRKQWQERERLVYPLTYAPLALTAGMTPRQLIVPFLRDPVMWVGFGLAFLYDLTNMLRAYNPSVPAVGTATSIAQFFSERPWNVFIQYNQVFHHPEIIGFGYLMNTEMAFSIWGLYLLERVAAVASTALGHEAPYGLHEAEQAGGAYVAMAILLVWVSREHLHTVLRKAANPRSGVDDSSEPLSYRSAVVASVGGLGVLILWASIAGIAPWLAILFFALLLGTIVVYARIRAEIGVPVINGFPAAQTHEAIKYVLGPRTLVRYGGWRSATMYQAVYFIAYSQFIALGANHVESYKMATGAGIKLRSVVWILTGAMLAGYLIGYWTRLGVYYEYGSGGATSVIGWGTAHGKSLREELVNWTTAFPSPDRAKIIATGVGFLITVALARLRMVWLCFPLHPLGYCLACTNGINLWNHMLIVWVIKVLVLKLGGMRVYRRLIPCFIGIAIGRFMTAGILNNLIGIIGGEKFQRYGVWFN